MSYLTMEAEIDHGRIIPSEPHNLPETGRALLTVLTSAPKPNLENVKALLGSLKLSIDATAWQRKLRSEWDER